MVKSFQDMWERRERRNKLKRLVCPAEREQIEGRVCFMTGEICPYSTPVNCRTYNQYQERHERDY